MIIVLLGLKYIIPFVSTNRLVNILYVAGFSIVGAVIYFVIMFRSRLIYDIFGHGNVEKVLNKIRKGR